MVLMKEIEAFPLYWPEGQKRIPVSQQKRNWPFYRGTLDKHRRRLVEEVTRLRGLNLVISTNMPLRKDGNLMASAKEPDDCGVAVYFTREKKSMCFACDQFGTVRENIRAIALTIASIRAIERYGASDMMERAFRGFTAIPEKTGDWWRAVLELALDGPVTLDQIESSFKRLAQTAHPDKGGTQQEFIQLVNARASAKRDIGVTT